MMRFMIYMIQPWGGEGEGGEGKAEVKSRGCWIMYNGHTPFPHKKSISREECFFLFLKGEPPPSPPRE